MFKPFNEKSAFKPITPVPKSSIKIGDVALMNGDLQIDCNTNDGNEHVHNVTTSAAAPRICGTSLKRHISNVETYNRERSIDETNSMSDDDDSASVTPPSSSSASTARGKRLHYADLAPLCASLTSTSNTNLNLINSTTSSSRNNNINNNNNSNNCRNTGKINSYNNNGSASNSNSSSCTISFCDSKNETDANPNGLSKTDGLSASSNASMPINRPTQYATLKFNEVNI